MTAIAEETLAFRCGEFSSPFSLLMPTFAFHSPPVRLTPILRRPVNALLPQYAPAYVHRFGDVLDARLLSTPAPLDQ